MSEKTCANSQIKLSLLRDRVDFVRQRADWARKETLRLHALAPETRIASALSCVEIFAVFFYAVLSHGSDDSPRGHRFVLSKGHGALSLYPILADKGLLHADEVSRLCTDGARLGAIPDGMVPGLDMVSGSLGHGLGVACGISLALNDRSAKERVFALLGDGELYEGSVWEAIMFAGAQRLANLVAVVDSNRVSMLDYCKNIIDLEPLQNKFKAFGWDALVVDGHDVEQLLKAVSWLTKSRVPRPKALIARTVKGKGVPRLETDPLCHVRSMSTEEVNLLIQGTQ